jgi:tRNA U34 5-carboxymethylaminomethyl modifying GTPase MnmE/TrmE
MSLEAPHYLRPHPAIAEAYLAYQSNKNALNEAGMRVAACGIYNAGKSSLLNALVDKFEEGAEAFETGDVRTTAKVVEWKLKQLTFVDTPGVDGAAEDEETAWQGVLRSDYFFYVHRLRAVEFEQRELHFLKRLKEHTRDLESRLALVISQIDGVGSDEDASSCDTAIRKAFADAVGFEPEQVFPVSVTRFIKGTQEAKPALVARSGIPALKQWIDLISSPPGQARWERLRADRLDSEKDVLAQQILALAEDVDTDIQMTMAKRQSRLRSLEKDMTGLLRTIKTALARIDSAA